MKMHTLTATCQVLTDDVSSLQNSLKEEKQRTDDLQIKLDDADSTIENMNVQSTSLKTDSNDSVEIENDWQNKVRELEQLLSTVQEEKDDLETKLKNYEHEKQEINSRLEALESETMDKDRELIRFLEDETKSLNEENEKIKEELTKMEHQLDGDTQLIEEFNNKLQTIQKHEQLTSVELDDLKEKFEIACQDKEILLQQLKSSNDKIIEYDNQVKIASQKLASVQEDECVHCNQSTVKIESDCSANNFLDVLKQLSDQHDELKTQINFLQNDKNVLDQNVQELKQLSDQHDELKTQINFLQNDKNILGQNVQELKQVIENNYVNLAAKKSNIENLQDAQENADCRKTVVIQYFLDQLRENVLQCDTCKTNVLNYFNAHETELTVDFNENSSRNVSQSNINDNSIEFIPVNESIDILKQRQDLNSKVADLETSHENVNKLKEMLSEIKNENTMLIDNNQQLKNENLSLKESIEEKHEMVIKLHNQLDDLLSKNEELSLAMEDRQKNIVFLEKNISTLQIEVCSKKSELEKTKLIIEKLESDVLAKDNFEKENSEFKNRVINLQKDIEALESSNGQFKALCDNVQSQLSDINVKSDEQDRIILELRSDKESMTAKFEKGKTEMESKILSMEHQVNDVSNSNDDTSKLLEKVKALENEKISLEKNYHELEKHNTEIEKKFEDLNLEKQEIVSRFQDQVSVLKSEIDSQNNQIEELMLRLKATEDDKAGIVKNCEEQEEKLVMKNTQLEEDVINLNHKIKFDSEELEDLRNSKIEHLKIIENVEEINTNFQAKYLQQENSVQALNVHISELKDELDKLDCENKNLRKEVKELENSRITLEDKVTSCLNENNVLIKNLQDQINDLNAEIDSKNKNHLELKIQIQESATTIAALRENLNQNNVSDSMQKASNDEIDGQNNQIEELMLRLKVNEDDKAVILKNCEEQEEKLVMKNTQLEEDIRNLNHKIKSDSEELEDLRNSKNEHLKIIENVEEINTNFQAKYLQQENSVQALNVHNSELKDELDKLDCENKNLQKEVKELENSRITLEDKVTSCVNENNVLIKNLQAQINDLNAEIDSKNKYHLELKNQIQESATTIAALRENSNQKNVSDSMQKASNDEILQSKLKATEEKLLKIKAIAVKTKKESNENVKKMSEVVSERDALQKKLEYENQKSNSSLQHLQNYQSLQNEYDRAQDLIEEEKVRSKKFEQDLELILHELSTLKAKYFSLEKDKKQLLIEAEKTTTEKNNLFKGMKELEVKIVCLEEEKRQEIKKQDALKIEVDKSNSKVEETSRLLKDTKSQLVMVSDKLNSYLKESKKQNLIDLEMADYERTVSSMQTEIHAKNSTIQELNNDKGYLDDKIVSLQEQIKCLETVKSEYEAHNEKLKALLEKIKKELGDVQEVSNTEKNKLLLLQGEFEVLHQQAEGQKVVLLLQIAELSSENRKLQDSIQILKENHQVTIRNYESKLIKIQDQLQLIEKEYNTCQQDYESYKARVHSVFKQQKKQTSTSVENDEETRNRLQEIIDHLKVKLEDVRMALQAETFVLFFVLMFLKNIYNEVQANRLCFFIYFWYKEIYKSFTKLISANCENESLQGELDNLTQSNADISQELEKNNSVWSKRHDEIILEKNKVISENVEIVSCLHREIEQQSKSYKKQLEFLSENNNKKIEDLEKDLDNAKIEIKTLEEKRMDSQQNISPLKEDEVGLELVLPERQEGEGSESTEVYSSTRLRSPATPPLHKSGFTPLEKLIQPSFVPTSSWDEMISSMDTIEADSSEISSLTKKVEHLSELLKEAEEGNMRLSEQTIILKNEIRRLERNKEREEHSENLEYMKNVILKYMTLPIGDERLRLVPVLTTMLRLSPEEKTHLQDFAGGESVKESETHASSWGGLLHHWSGMS
ncbi:GRIP and coiled-coil domain-containing protein 2 [Nymphon striatum]|nr:GRIP and coiled-coil domain-containing protein 2 [Nymphon striatum]